MSESRRVQKVERSVREVISAYLISGFREPLPAFVSVPRVSVSPDLKNARVYVSVFGENEDEVRAECLEILNEFAFDVQRHVGRELKMKFCPKIKFVSDDGHQAALRVESKLHEIRKSQEAAEKDVVEEASDSTEPGTDNVETADSEKTTE